MRLLRPVLFILVILFFSCGLDEYYYLSQVQEGIGEFNDYAEIYIQNDSSYNNTFFSHFTIFYRIYVSTQPDANINSTPLNLINSSLLSHYNTLLPITNPDNSQLPSQNTFRNLNYYEPALERISDGLRQEMRQVLTSGGTTLQIYFPNLPGEGSEPYLVHSNGHTYRLLRSSSLISPLPSDRYFFNSSILQNPYNAILPNRGNVDVEHTVSQNPPVETGDYTYVSMYIAAVGYNIQTFTYFYSKPTHINVFRLPDKFYDE